MSEKNTMKTETDLNDLTNMSDGVLWTYFDN